MAKKMSVDDLVIDESLFIRSGLNEDAVQRYMEMYKGKKQKAIKVQKGTNRLIDGFHRVEAAKRLGLKKVLGEIVDIEDHDLRALAYKCNKSHGVPISREERNNLIVKLYFEDGKTQQQIADLMGLSQKQVSEIINNIP